jgi:hypothetical protein
MIKIITRSVIILVFLGSFQVKSLFSQSESIPSSLTFYKKGAGVNVSMKLTLSENKTFTEHTDALSCVDRSMATNTISGTYILEKKRIKLIPTNQLYYDYQGNPLKVIGTNEILKKNTLFIDEYDIVFCKKLILLLNDSTTSGRYTNDFIDIANAINKNNGNTEIDYIWKNKDDDAYKVDKDLADCFPPQWKNYILTNPITANVIKTRISTSADKKKYTYLDNNSKYLFTLDVGEEAGIREGMILYATGKNDCLCELIILETEKKQSVAYIRQWQENSCEKLTKFSTNK